jgi:hypothetical protein
MNELLDEYSVWALIVVLMIRLKIMTESDDNEIVLWPSSVILFTKGCPVT